MLGICTTCSLPRPACNESRGFVCEKEPHGRNVKLVATRGLRHRAGRSATDWFLYDGWTPAGAWLPSSPASGYHLGPCGCMGLGWGRLCCCGLRLVLRSPTVDGPSLERGLTVSAFTFLLVVSEDSCRRHCWLQEPLSGQPSLLDLRPRSSGYLLLASAVSRPGG